MKKVLKIILIVILALVLIVAGYVAYVFIAFHRIGDQQLEVKGNTDGNVSTGEEYSIVSWNIGFGAYESDYGFFMDGGTESWAWSEERLDANLKNIVGELDKYSSDFYLIQEVDIDSTRTYHVDERVPIYDMLTEDRFASAFAQNYDSPFLFYPLTQPHGASRSGILTFSGHGALSAERKEVPIENGITKLLDLDRCYSKMRIDGEDGRELVLYNTHLSAYTSDGTIAEEQLKLLLADMEDEYAKGNWCIAGGDFNKDLLGDSSKYFGASDTVYTWAQPIPEEIFENTEMKLIAPIDEENPVPSCRNADGPYHEGQFVLTIDGFIISPNVEMTYNNVIDTGFEYSDHNPVTMTFSLK